jgi:hypothetical protein
MTFFISNKRVDGQTNICPPHAATPFQVGIFHSPPSSPSENRIAIENMTTMLSEGLELERYQYLKPGQNHSKTPHAL